MSSNKDGEKLRVLVKMICSSFLDATEAIEKDVWSGNLKLLIKACSPPIRSVWLIRLKRLPCNMAGILVILLLPSLEILEM